MTPQQHANWCDQWEAYAAEMTACRQMPADAVGEFIETLREIRALPEVQS